MRGDYFEMRDVLVKTASLIVDVASSKKKPLLRPENFGYKESKLKEARFEIKSFFWLKALAIRRVECRSSFEMRGVSVRSVSYIVDVASFTKKPFLRPENFGYKESKLREHALR